MQSYFFPEITPHAELTGLCCGYVIEQAIKTNQTIDCNNLINSIDDFLADYADVYGLVHYNRTQFQ